MDVHSKPQASARFSQKRHAFLLDTAMTIFVSRGLGSATIDEIAQVAGISKATIYRRYANKDELFEAAIIQTTEPLAQAFKEIELDPATPEASLTRAADTIYYLMRQPRQLEVFRAIVAEASRLPLLVQRSRLQMLATLTQSLTSYFQQLVAAGVMVSPYPEQSAVNFIILTGGGMRPLLGVGNDGSSSDEQRRREADLDLFLRGTGIRVSHA
ncbi:transcriptional regulator [Pseudomonas sp. GM21]|uniref:TetR/AcrR family transcriptional regulator n=1 Tax=Pseudomonas sp. GM21 TaxID=1144325 RepID=UPI0002725EC3|nr:TetR/AcrR family transcriptional regulator [Pseudomonas sp. GM21]EJM24379.1 transcriptional regulator [Pseudomonas sp. GM21]